MRGCLVFVYPHCSLILEPTMYFTTLFQSDVWGFGNGIFFSRESGYRTSWRRLKTTLEILSKKYENFTEQRLQHSSSSSSGLFVFFFFTLHHNNNTLHINIQYIHLFSYSSSHFGRLLTWSSSSYLILWSIIVSRKIPQV